MQTFVNMFVLVNRHDHGSPIGKDIYRKCFLCNIGEVMFVNCENLYRIIIIKKWFKMYSTYQDVNNDKRLMKL